MIYRLLSILILAFAWHACGYTHKNENITTADDAHGHSHGPADDLDELQLTAYGKSFEVFINSHPLVAGNKSVLQVHITQLSDFSALDGASVEATVEINGEKQRLKQLKSDTEGIYSFRIDPEKGGIGQLIFEVTSESISEQIIIDRFRIYKSEHQASHEVGSSKPSLINTTVFSKEQSWKVDFATEMPEAGAFGQIIKTTAQIQSAPEDVILISAKTNGIVLLAVKDVLEGKSVNKGEVLFNISGIGLADNNSAVRFSEARNNYEKASSDYQRLKKLAEDQIVSRKDLLQAKNHYQNTRIIYDNLNRNFDEKGQIVASPFEGYVKHIYVEEGQYVEPGQAIVSISQNKKLLLHADIQQKYASILSSIQTANIRTVHDNQTFTLEELNGSLLSYGKSTSQHNYQIPIHFQIDNPGHFVSGGFVELFLKTTTNPTAISVPNEAVLEEQGNYFVFVQVHPELFEKREIKIGATDGLRTEIISGIRASERIVSKGAILVSLAQATGTLDAHSGHVH